MAPPKNTEESKKTTAYKRGAKPKAKHETTTKPKAMPKATQPKNTKPVPPSPKEGAKGAKGGSVISDVSKLAVPFGLIAAKSSLESFLKNRKAKKPPVAPVKSFLKNRKAKKPPVAPVKPKA